MIADKENICQLPIPKKKNFTSQQAADLFLSVRWVVGKYSDRLHKALMNSSRVISAWDGDRLVGFIRVMDDRKNASFYEKHGFKIKEDSLPMQYRNVPKYTKS